MNQDFCQKFKKTLSKFSTGVTIATTKHEEVNYGVTINSFASLSLEPALILFNLDVSSHSLSAFLNCKFFNINIMSKQQQELSKHFAANYSDKFLGQGYQEDNNHVPIFLDNLALISCRMHSSKKVGDHYIVIGEVYEADYDDNKEPLIYFNSIFA
ncbi:MAG: flavin reductase family protein [Rickettsiales bacterium]|jgi:3-hydroxy-9,10-secoandrosta-1,3,5(10)-triene-9,17-dione monooxygenase reductase component|nr:flavin reductase family protein [Rickettsiales bacterium]